MTKNEIDEICKKYKITHYTINQDKSVDVYQNVDLIHKDLKKIPFNFNKIEGNFHCSINSLDSLKGCPNYVSGSFSCSDNNLTSLKGCPNYVGENFYCDDNTLNSLKYSPEYVGNNYSCSKNYITSLKYTPKHIEGNFFCAGNKLKTLKNSPDTIKGDFVFMNNKIKSFYYLPNARQVLLLNNPIEELWLLFSDKIHIDYFNELDIIVKNETTVILDRLNYFLTDIGKQEISKDSIKNYKVV